MIGLDFKDTPFNSEIGAVFNSKSKAFCHSFSLELHSKGNIITPIAVLRVIKQKNFLKDYYPIISVEFQCTLGQKEHLIDNMDDIQAILKTYKHPLRAPYSIGSLYSPVIRTYKAKLYLTESDYVSQNNFGVNNAEYVGDKTLVSVMVQLVEKGFEELKTRYVGGTYRNIAGGPLIRHLIDYHANLNNDDVNTLLSGVDFAMGENTEVVEQLSIPDGTSLIEAMHVVNENSGGIFPAGFSYYIHNNVWYVYPPYSLNRFNQDSERLIIVNVPKDRIPGIETSYSADTNTIIILSTRETIIKDDREAKRIEGGTGTRFTDVRTLMRKFGIVKENKLCVKASDNVNDLSVDKRVDGTNYTRFAKQRLTSAKNIELSKLAPSKGFMMQLSWENSDDSIVKPGMGVKVLYLHKNQVKSAIGSVMGINTEITPYEDSYPPKKYTSMSFIDVFVSNEEISNE